MKLIRRFKDDNKKGDDQYRGIFLCPVCEEDVDRNYGNGMKATTCSNSCQWELYFRTKFLGHTFNGCKVLESLGVNNGGQRIVLVECSCGQEFTCLLPDLVRGHTTSCGCYRSAIVSACRRKHGDSLPDAPLHPLYRSWMSMRDRCANLDGYADHSICSEWDSYETFKAWSIANGWEQGHHLHHEGKVYSPTACQWLSKSDHLNLHVEREKLAA